MADPSVVIEAQSTAFARVGETFQTIQRTNPSAPFLVPLSFGVWGNVALIPGGVTLYDVQAQDPTLFYGAGTLYNLYNIDPFGTDYENETNDLYTRSFAIARAAILSGPANVRGGTARQAFELAEFSTLMSINRFKEIWQNQLAAWKLVLESAQVANASAAEINRERLQAQQQQAATENAQRQAAIESARIYNDFNRMLIENYTAQSNFSLTTMKTEESFTGQGTQGPIVTSFGSSSYR